MLITTTNEIPGYAVEEVYGEVFGLTVRSRNFGSQMGAGLKSLVGGERRRERESRRDPEQHAAIIATAPEPGPADPTARRVQSLWTRTAVP